MSAKAQEERHYIVKEFLQSHSFRWQDKSDPQIKRKQKKPFPNEENAGPITNELTYDFNDAFDILMG